MLYNLTICLVPDVDRKFNGPKVNVLSVFVLGSHQWSGL
jgi:hypothetical protein